MTSNDFRQYASDVLQKLIEDHYEFDLKAFNKKHSDICSLSSLYNYTRGKSKPTVNKAKKIIKALKTDYAEELKQITEYLLMHEKRYCEDLKIIIDVLQGCYNARD